MSVNKLLQKGTSRHNQFSEAKLGISEQREVGSGYKWTQVGKLTKVGTDKQPGSEADGQTKCLYFIFLIKYYWYRRYQIK